MPEMSIGPSQTGIFIPLIGAPRLALPMDEVRVSAGFPSPAADYEDKRLDINEYLVRKPPLIGICTPDMIVLNSPRNLRRFVSDSQKT